MKPVIIGAGLAGLTAALSLAPQPVCLLSSRQLGNATSSAWAQGGIAAAVAEGDTPALHAEDTLKAGAGLCNPAIVKEVTEAAPGIIDWLVEKGVQFDGDAKGAWRLGLEGGHSRRRILHAQGDSTGLAIMKALIAALRRTPQVDVIEDVRATEICIDDGRVTGVVVERDGMQSILSTDCVVLATGGAGALWKHTTNPLGSWGGGFILAARAGAALGDLEFMQFHPTAIDTGRDPMPLASEALRGEGAVLIDETGLRFMEGHGRAELEPRDIVARAIWHHVAEGHRVFLDARQAIGGNFASHFPFVHKLCLESGLDPVRQPIPVCPAAHYHMGGVMTDARGRSNVEGLWACGEVACTGLHGANRLASNSLLEAVWSGQKVARDISALEAGTRLIQGHARSRVPLPELSHKRGARTAAPISQQVRGIMSAYVGVLRDREGLEKAVDQLTPWAQDSAMALAGLCIAHAALARKESRGAQARTDYPALSSQGAQRQTLTLADIEGAADNPRRKRIAGI